MEQTFYVNVLFGKNRQRIFDELKTKFMNRNVRYRFQINPYRINPLSELSSNSKKSSSYSNLRNETRQHTAMLNDINGSNIESVSAPFENIIFVNYTTKELEPALRFDRVRYYLCDYINDENIEIVTMSNLVYINFLNKIPRNNMYPLNAHFMPYATLVMHDTDADNRISNATTLDLGEETSDDVTFLLQKRLTSTHIDDGDEMLSSDNIANSGIILPYHPFRHSLFASVQNTKDNINAVLISRNKHLIYYPFNQTEWLRILKMIMYEHVILNFLVTDKLYENEKFAVHNKMPRNVVSCCVRHINRLNERYKTQVFNDIVFNYRTLFNTRNSDKTNWLKRNYLITNILPQFAANFQGLNTSNGILV